MELIRLIQFKYNIQFNTVLLFSQFKNNIKYNFKLFMEPVTIEIFK